jgi:conjugal transfer pilus assembly protein TraV
MMNTINLAALSAALLIAGCGGLSGLGGTTDYACPMPDGSTCKSMSEAYRDTYRARPTKTPDESTTKDGNVSQRADVLGDRVRPARPVSLAPAVGTPLLSAPRLMRILIAPWTDADDHLIEEHRVFVKIDAGHWQLDHVNASIANAYGPIAAPTKIDAAAADDHVGPAAKPPRSMSSSAPEPFFGSGSAIKEE